MKLMDCEPVSTLKRRYTNFTGGYNAWAKRRLAQFLVTAPIIGEPIILCQLTHMPYDQRADPVLCYNLPLCMGGFAHLPTLWIRVRAHHSCGNSVTMADQPLTQPHRSRPLVVGMTGNIATGKSTVLAYLAGLGARVIDADRLAHRAMEPGGPAYDGVIAQFGPGLVRADGLIDRQKLGQIVFAEPVKLQALEQLVHPAVFALAQQEMRQATAEGAQVIIIEAIKLLESGRLLTLCDEIWVVTAPETAQLARMMHDRGMSEEDARRRMAAQSPQAEKVARADRVIDNGGSSAALRQQLDELWQTVLSLHGPAG